MLAFIALLKRSVSTVEACKSTLSVVADRFRELAGREGRERGKPPPAPPHPAGISSQAGTLRHGQQRGGRRANTRWRPRTWPTSWPRSNARFAQAPDRSAKVSSIVDRLEELIEMAGDALAQDPKLDQLVHEIDAIRQQEPKANVLIYTEYVDSQRAAVAALKASARHRHRSDHVLATTTTRSGRPVTEQFRSQQGIILVSTDSAAEGLNLHNAATTLSTWSCRSIPTGWNSAMAASTATASSTSPSSATSSCVAPSRIASCCGSSPSTSGSGPGLPSCPTRSG